MNHFELWKITAYFEVGLVTTLGWQVPLESHIQAKCEAHDEIMRSSVSHGTLCRIILDCLRLAVSISKEVRLAHNDRKANHSNKQFSHRSGHYLIFFCLPFSRPINEPNLGKTLSSFQQLPRLGLKPWRAFWADMAPFKGPQTCLVHCFLELHITKIKDIVKSTDVNLDFVFVKTYTLEGLFFMVTLDHEMLTKQNWANDLTWFQSFRGNFPCHLREWQLRCFGKELDARGRQHSNHQ